MIDYKKRIKELAKNLPIGTRFYIDGVEHLIISNEGEQIIIIPVNGTRSSDYNFLAQYYYKVSMHKEITVNELKLFNLLLLRGLVEANKKLCSENM